MIEEDGCLGLDESRSSLVARRSGVQDGEQVGEAEDIKRVKERGREKEREREGLDT